MADEATAQPFRFATMDEAQRWIEAGEVVVYDANGAAVHEKHHLPGARHVTGGWVDGLPADRSRRLLFYCSGPT